MRKATTLDLSYDVAKLSEPSRALSLKHILVILVPAFLALGLILQFAVDVPKEDEWKTPGAIYQHLIDDSLTIKDFFIQHTESRDTFPRLIFLAVGLMFGWQVTILMVLSWLCVVATLLVLLTMLPPSLTQRPARFLPIGLLLGALLFSPAQWENQLWGIQLIFFLPPLCVALCLWVQSTRISYRYKVLVCAGLSLIATFSYANGMVCWLLGNPFLRTWFTEWPEAFLRERSKVLRWTAMYIILAVVTIGFYFWGFTWSPNAYVLALQDPGLWLQFFASLVGAPFSQHANAQVMTATLVGLGIILVACLSLGIFIRQWIRSRDAVFVTSCYPWMCLFGYGLISILAVTSGRSKVGLEASLVSAYATVSLWFTIGLVGVMCVLWNIRSMKTHAVTNLIFSLPLGMLGLLTILAWVAGIDQMKLEHFKAQQRLLNLRLLPLTPSNPFFERHRSFLLPELILHRFVLTSGHDLLPVEPMGTWIAERMENPDPGVAGSFIIKAPKDQDIAFTPEELIRGLTIQDKAVQIEGWAMLPPQGVPPDFVILGKLDDSGTMQVITGFIPKVERSDIVGAFNNPNLRLSGFSDTVDATFLEFQGLMMFAVDLKNRKVYQLQLNLEASTLVSYFFFQHFDEAEIITEFPDAVTLSEPSFAINNEMRRVLFEHPKSEVVFHDVTIPKYAHLEFGVGIKEPAWNKAGDGVLFEILLRDEASQEHLIFSQWVDPKNNLEDRRWFDHVLDLKSFSGQVVSFRFKTSGGPEENYHSDWAGWSGPQIIINPRPEAPVVVGKLQSVN